MAAENSFDVVCKVDMQEVTNALDQVRREIETRYDLKGSKNEVTLEKTDVVITSADDMKLKALTWGTVEDAAGGAKRQKITLQQGIPTEKAKEIVRLIKDTKLKVQASIQESQDRKSTRL